MKPKKSLGQNFLTDKTYLDLIASHCISGVSGALIEIGPGRAYLTRAILDKMDKQVQLTSVEIDTRAEEYLLPLKGQYANFNYVISDARTYDYSDAVTVVGNLPYNAGTNLLLSCVKARVKRMVFLLQSEVVDRIKAQPRNGDYSSLSVLVQAYYEVRSALTVPPSAFYPAPKVYSKLLVCNLRDGDLPEYVEFSSLLRSAFQYPRKTLQNNLGRKLSSLIDGSLRPNYLSVGDYITLLQSANSHS